MSDDTSDADDPWRPADPSDAESVTAPPGPEVPVVDDWQPGPPKPGAAGVPLPPVALPPGVAAPVPGSDHAAYPTTAASPAGGWAGTQAGTYGMAPVRYTSTSAYTRRNVSGLGRLAVGACMLFGVAAPWFVAKAGDRFVWARAWSFEGWRVDDMVGFKALAVASGVTVVLGLLEVVWKPRIGALPALAALGGLAVAAGAIYNLVVGWGTDRGLHVYGGPGLFLPAAGGLLVAIGGLRASLTARA